MAPWGAVRHRGDRPPPMTEGDGLARSLRLARAFRHEQREPERFYRVLAADSVAQVSRYVDLRGAMVLDVGGGPGWFDDAFTAAGARYWVVERDDREATGSRAPKGGGRVATVVADGAALPFRHGRFDLCFSSNVLEHVAAPWRFLDEVVRAVRPGGIVFCAFTNWLSPWGGHETSPWHLLGGEAAARRYERRHGHAPKNRVGRTLFPVHVGDVLRWARANPDVELVDARPRYYPEWCRPLVSVPGLREVATWNLATVLRRR
jgi:SAM-dependent methyltransferase